jgi:hypothetical protein
LAHGKPPGGDGQGNGAGNRLERYSGDAFTAEERQFLRRMMEEERHVAWFWASVRRWAFWTAGAVAGIITFRENIKAFIIWFSR